MRFGSAAQVEEALSSLAEMLDAAGSEPLSLLVCGGAALMVMGQATRGTQDVDLLTYFDRLPLQEAELQRRFELPDEVRLFAGTVARDMGLDPNWLNLGPSSLVQLGLPAGLLGRAQSRQYGDSLTALYVDRLDQIHLKLYASLARDERHVADLLALEPDPQEMLLAGRWVLAVAGEMVLKDDLQKLIGDLGHDITL